MAAPVVTTLLTPNPADGTTSALTIGTETTLASSTSLSQGGAFKPAIDMTNMADGDILEVRGYNQATSGSSLVEAWVLSLANGQTDLCPDLPETVAVYAYKLTLKQTAGTGRTFAWAVANMYGT